MPYFHLTTNATIPAAEKHALCNEIGKLMPLLPGKSRDNTMMQLDDARFMEMGDNALLCGHLEVRLYKASPTDAKQAFVAAVSKLFEEKLAIPQDRLYINLIEYDAWASNGKIKY